LLQFVLISNANQITKSYSTDKEEANLIIKLENWSAPEGEFPSTSFDFYMGEKLFGVDTHWNITAVNYNDFFHMTGIFVSDIAEVNNTDRFLQSSVSILSCDGGDPIAHYDSAVESGYATSTAFYNQDIIDHVCPGNFVRFAVKFRLYKGDTLMNLNSGVISNELPYVIYREMLPNSSFVDMTFTSGQDEWGKSSTWKFFGPWETSDDYEITLLSTDFPSGKVYGAGWFEIWNDFLGTRYIYILKEFSVGESYRVKLSREIYKDSIELKKSSVKIHNVELYWETFGESARFSDYVYGRE